MTVYGFNRENSSRLLRLARADAARSIQRGHRGRVPAGGLSDAMGLPLSAPIEFVQVWKTSGSPVIGDILQADASGYHPGRVRRRVEGVMTTVGDTVKVRFADFHDDDLGQVFATHGKYYPCLLIEGGEGTPVADTVYLALNEDTQYIAKIPGGLAKGSSGSFDLYHRATEVDSTFNKTAKALGEAIPAAKWTTVQKFGPFWYAGCWES